MAKLISENKITIIAPKLKITLELQLSKVMGDKKHCRILWNG
jgi:hypothetical protein